jgi:hypothetical protein
VADELGQFGVIRMDDDELDDDDHDEGEDENGETGEDDPDLDDDEDAADIHDQAWAGHEHSLNARKAPRRTRHDAHH